MYQFEHRRNVGIGDGNHDVFISSIVRVLMRKRRTLGWSLRFSCIRTHQSGKLTVFKSLTSTVGLFIIQRVVDPSGYRFGHVSSMGLRPCSCLEYGAHRIGISIVGAELDRRHRSPPAPPPGICRSDVFRREEKMIEIAFASYRRVRGVLTPANQF